MKRYIVAMSKSQSDMAAWIEDHTYPAMRVLAQLYLFPDSDLVNHWKTKLIAAFGEMHIFSRNKKLPSKKFIYTNSWLTDNKFVHDAIDWAIDKEKELTPRTDINEQHLYNMMEKYFDWLSGELSQHRGIVSSDVNNILKQIGFISE